MLQATLVVVALATAATGIVLCFIGVTRAGRAIRFVPFPVIGGFLGATGWLMITGAMQVVTDRAPTFVTIGSYANSQTSAKSRQRWSLRWRCISSNRRSKSPFVLPGTAACGICGGIRGVTDHRIVCRHSTGRRLDVYAATRGGRPRLAVEDGAFAGLSWNLLPTLSGDLLAIVFVTVSTLLFNTTGIEIATRTKPISTVTLKLWALPTS